MGSQHEFHLRNQPHAHTSKKQRRRNQSPVLRLEPLKKRYDGHDVEKELYRARVHYRKGIQAVHCRQHGQPVSTSHASFTSNVLVASPTSAGTSAPHSGIHLRNKLAAQSPTMARTHRRVKRGRRKRYTLIRAGLNCTTFWLAIVGVLCHVLLLAVFSMVCHLASL